jgi:chemotaxis response regulator CheB
MSKIRDTNLKKTKALPAAAATNYSDSIDLLDSAPGIKMRNAEIEVALPATPSLVDAKTVTLTLQDSADNSTFAAIPTLATVVATGVSTSGAAAITRLFKLPETARRYIRLKQDVLTAGGDNTAISTTLSVVY